MMMRLFAVEESGKEINDPDAAPAGMPAPVLQAAFDRFACRCEYFRRIRRNLIERMESHQMTHVPMAGLAFLIVFDPFLHGTVFTDLFRPRPPSYLSCASN